MVFGNNSKMILTEIQCEFLVNRKAKFPLMLIYGLDDG
jgi:hypothetical protein